MDGPTAYLIQHGYVVLFAWVAAEQFALPVPSEPVLFAVGALAGAGLLSLPFAIAVGVGASLLSDSIWYEIGRARGSQVSCFCGAAAFSASVRLPGAFTHGERRAFPSRP